LPLDVKFYTNALDALASIPDASLIATPDAAAVDITAKVDGGTVLANIAKAVTNKCADLPSFFYVIDAPYLDVSASDDSNLTAWSSGQPLGSEHTAIYYPWPIILNPISGKSVPVPPSGAVIGRYATTDLVAGVHVSPAGVRTGRLTTAVSMTRWLTENDQASLNPLGINVIRSIPGYGITVYGARTLAGPGEWQYVAVRRFVTFVEQSLKMSLEWVVFQPNGEMLWGTVVREVTAFLNQLWRQGALFGATASEAFFVTCDNSNNDATTRAQGVLNVDVGLAVLYPAEFVVIRIAQMTTGSA
jgi:phage tail sheath protein FI